MTKPVTRKMAVDCLLWRFFNGAEVPRRNEQGTETRQAIITCGICDGLIFAGDDIQFDHIHADVFDGPHEYQNLRPVHAECHKIKTKADVQANAKVKRIIAGGRKKRGPKLPSKPFPKTKRKLPTRKFHG